MGPLRIDDAWWPRPARGSHRHTVGTRPADPDTWLRPRPGDSALLERKHADLAAHSSTFRALPGTEAAGEQVRRLLRAEQTGLHPLADAARAVVEDLCLIDVSHAPALVGGCVAWPSGWSVAEKIGLPVVDLHDPVPHYRQQVGAAADAVMSKVEGARILARLNWTMQAGDALHRPPGTEGTYSGDPARDVQLRVEYQTLRRVTDSAVLFTIRTAMEPLAALLDRPGLVHATADALAQLPPEQADYKGMQAFAADALHWLQARSVP